MTNKEKLFKAIYEACPELNHIESLGEGVKGITIKHDPIQISHILRTANARGKVISIDQKGQVWIAVKDDIENTEWKYVCTIDLTKSISDQSEATLIQLAKMIL